MSTLVEIEQAIDRLPDWGLDQLAEWLDKRRSKKSARPRLLTEPDFMERARQIWGDRPLGARVSELVSSSRA
jgi:hypothetical protein